jgi:glycosyltransferase involved in cell wall biosynthesis
MPQEDLLPQIQTSDLYVHAAEVEIEGLSCMEAFACGVVPVIGDAEKSAAKQFAIDGRCIFEAGNADSLRRRIEYWLENPEERLALGERYAAHAENFRIESSARRLVEMFEEAYLAEKGRANTNAAKKNAEADSYGK